MKLGRCSACDFVNVPDSGNRERYGIATGNGCERATGESVDGSCSEGVPLDTELGRKVLFWVTIYSSVMAVPSLLAVGLGLILASQTSIFESADPQGDILAGLRFGSGGAAFAIL